MQPNQPAGPDYSFLDNPSNSSKSKLFGSGGNKQRLLTVAAVGGVILVVFMVIFTLLFGGGGGNTESLVGIVAQQNELIRISDMGEKDATSIETKNFASTVGLSLTTAENQLSAILDKQGRKLSAAETGAAKDSKTDTALTTAAQINRFDEIFNQTMKTSLQKYQKSLQTAYESSSSKSEKATLQDLYTKAKILTETVPGN